MKLYKLLIGLPLMGLILAGILIFYGDGVDKYSPSGYNETDLQELANLSRSTSYIENTQGNLTEYGADQDADDTAETLLVGAYRGATAAGQSITIFGKVINLGASNLPFLGSYANTLIAGILAIITIAILIGIIMQFATRSDRN